MKQPSTINIRLSIFRNIYRLFSKGKLSASEQCLVIFGKYLLMYRLFCARKGALILAIYHGPKSCPLAQFLDLVRVLSEQNLTKDIRIWTIICIKWRWLLLLSYLWLGPACSVPVPSMQYSSLSKWHSLVLILKKISSQRWQRLIILVYRATGIGGVSFGNMQQTDKKALLNIGSFGLILHCVPAGRAQELFEATCFLATV